MVLPKQFQDLGSDVINPRPLQNTVCTIYCLLVHHLIADLYLPPLFSVDKK